MDNTFDVDSFISRIGERLVQDFEDARGGTSPTAVGDAMEHPVRDQLEQILPRGIGVGSGFVVDSKGGTSKQTDVILYEKDICPVFSINKTAGTSYYPCEGVIAVGQVKSILDAPKLKEEFLKIASVKALERHLVHNFMPHPTTGEPIANERSYGSMQTPSVIDIGDHIKDMETRQISGFVLAGSLRLSIDTLMERFVSLTRENGEALSPNILAVLTGGMLTWGSLTNKREERLRSEETGTFEVRVTNDGPRRWESHWSVQSGELLSYTEEKESFRILLRWLYESFRTGKTSDARAFDQYFLTKAGLSSGERLIRPKATA